MVEVNGRRQFSQAIWRANIGPHKTLASTSWAARCSTFRRGVVSNLIGTSTPQQVVTSTSRVKGFSLAPGHLFNNFQYA